MATDRADYQYIVKELPNAAGAVWALECYPKTKELSFIRNGVMYIELKEGVSEEEAKELRKMLNARVQCITVINP